jgi:hypothetical protein
MTITITLNPPRHPYTIATLLAWTMYAALSFLTPIRENTYQLGQLQISLIQLTIVLPILAIWLVAANGAARLRQYMRLIRDSTDGQAFKYLSAGVSVLVLAFVLQSLVGSIAPFVVGTPYLTALVLFRNHLPVVLNLIAFGLIFVGSRQLNISTAHRLSAERTAIVLFPYAILAGLFAIFFYQNLEYVVRNGIPNFAVPGQWPFYTVALPYCLSWLLGITAIVNIAEYARFVSGTIYRRALSSLARGLSAVVLGSILIQLVSVANTFAAHLRLASILLLIYILLILYAVGFVLINRGAKKLIRIEDVT